MISSKDRSGYFGASDVSFIVGNWKTKTWLEWWMTKLGVRRNSIETVYMNAGTHWEHRLLEYIGCPEKDKQIIIESLKLRVNLDGNSEDTIYEVKTYKKENGYIVPLKHKEQVWVQMYVSGIRKAYVLSYGLEPEDYKNYFRDIDPERLTLHKIEYNEQWINEVFLPKLTRLKECLKLGIIPPEVLAA